jgi:hypothetical protein
MELEKLMELYRKSTPGEWKIAFDGNKMIIRSDEMFVLRPQLREMFGGALDADLFIDVEDVNLIVALHNSFPAIYKRLMAAEKMVKLLLKEFEALRGESTEIFEDLVCRHALTQLREEGIEID